MNHGIRICIWWTNPFRLQCKISLNPIGVSSLELVPSLWFRIWTSVKVRSATGMVLFCVSFLFRHCDGPMDCVLVLQQHPVFCSSVHQDEEFVTALINWQFAAIACWSTWRKLRGDGRKKTGIRLAQQSTYYLITPKCTVLELEIEQRCLQYMELKTASTDANYVDPKVILHISQIHEFYKYRLSCLSG